MRDIKIFSNTEEEREWSLDVRISEGEMILVDTEGQTQDQRAALASYTIKGTIPGANDEGINWDMFYDSDTSIITVDNQIRRNIEDKAGGDGTLQGEYTPYYITNKGKMEYIIYKGGQ